MITGQRSRERPLSEIEIPPEAVGRTAVATGALRPLREKLGLSRTAMAEYLYASVGTYTAWEENPSTTLWDVTADRIGRFMVSIKRQLALLQEEDIKIEDIIPLHLAASQLGIPQEVLMAKYREGFFDTVDLGILGLWLWRSDLPNLGVYPRWRQ